MKKIILLIVFVSLINIAPFPAKAELLTVTATVDDTVLVLKGYSSPDSLITFKENDVVIGTTTSSNSGAFEKRFVYQTVGVHIIQIYTTNANNLTTITVNQNLTLIHLQTLTLDKIYLPPSININSSSYTKNDKVKVSGYTKPLSLVNIEVAGKSGKLKLISSDDHGYYQTEFDTSDFNSGDHQITSTLQADLSTTSTKSNSLNFTINIVGTPSLSIALTSAPTQISTPILSTCPYEYENLCFFDTTKKGMIETKTELINFILGFIEYFSKPIANTFDINHDNVVDSTDLSIILFHTKATSENSQVLSATTTNIDSNNILGIMSPTLNFSITKENRFFYYLPTLFMLEFIVGIPFFIIFIFLIFVSKRYAKK